jgi:GTP pyrophosphokinase
MHKDAEEGIAAHWQYKQFKQDKHFDKRLALARQVAEWQQSSKDARQHIESLNIKFEKNQVFVFTPKKELIVLPEGATPIDFAYAVHSGLGNKCEKAKANGKIVPLDYRLENADAVEIITSERQKPKSQWLSFVKTDKAKQRIRQSLRIEGIMDGIKKKISAVRKIVPFQMKKGQQAVLAKCCNPLPGDEVVGYKTTKRKIKVHRADCPNLAEIPKEKRIAVPMEQFKEKNYRVEIAVKAQNKPGILTEMLDAISSFKAGINSTSAKTEEGNTFGCTFNITIKSSGELEKIVERLEKIKGVIKAERK